MSHAFKQLSVWLDGAINEGRIALDSLRSTPPEDISISLFKVSKACIPRSMKSNIVVEGAEIELEASVQDEAYRIAAETVRNACIHSDGSILTIKINYGRDLIIAVSDHGKGSDVLQKNQDIVGSGECMNARATLAPGYRAAAPERNTRIGLADAWRFLNEVGAPLKLGWAL